VTVPAAEAPALTPRMELLLGAARSVVAEQGLRGLTHRAVDRAAGLPEGSCSAYLRTRKALILALTGFVAHEITADVERLAGDLAGCALEDDQAIETVTAFFMRWLDERELLLARMELSLESSRDPELAAMLDGCRQGLVDLVDGILAARGKEHSDALAQTLVAAFDGVLFGGLPRPPEARQPFVRQSIEVLISGLG
jgi:DNA-binding transcriptional regulator YbjK